MPRTNYARPFLNDNVSPVYTRTYPEDEPALHSPAGLLLGLSFLEKKARQGGFRELAFLIGIAATAAEELAAAHPEPDVTAP